MTIGTTSASPLLQGTLDLLLLQALSLEPLHGLGAARRVEAITRGAFRVTPGSLFPALHRLEAQGALTSAWGASENNRRAKFYRLTAAGRRRLVAERADWSRIALAIGTAMETR